MYSGNGEKTLQEYNVGVNQYLDYLLSICYQTCLPNYHFALSFYL